MNEYKNRTEVPEKYRVNLSDMYQSDKEWYLEYEKVMQEYPKYAKYKGKIHNENDLYEFLNGMIEVDNKITNLYIYAQVSHDADLANEEYKIMKNKVVNLNASFNQTLSFFVPEFLKLSQAQFDALFTENSQLEDFRIYLKEIYKEKEHTLSEKEEELLAVLTETFQSYEDISSTLINSEHEYGIVSLDDGQKKEISANNIRFLKTNFSRKVRKNAQQKFGKKLYQYQDTASQLLYNYVKNNINLATIRNFDSPWQEKLFDIHISDQVFENMKDIAKQKAYTLQKYYKLIKKIVGVSKLHKYDTLVKWNFQSKSYTIEEAQSLIRDALQILGPDYIEKLDKIFDNHFIDYCQYKGKVNGGYSISGSTYPSRIMLSFNGEFDDVLTLAHEVGHSVHHEYLIENNLPWYRGSSTFCCEVASLTNEFLVNQYLIKSKNKDERLLGIERILKTFENNFFGAVIEGEIEQKMYTYVLEGNVLTPSYMNNLVLENSKIYENNAVINDNFAQVSWITRSHYFSDFYLFSYALCVSVAIVLANKIVHNEENILEKYKEFLSSGSEFYPKEIYQKLDIDIEDPKIFEEAIQYFDNYIDQYFEILKEGESLE